MYSIRLLLRAFGREVPCLHRSSASYKNTEPKERMYNHNNTKPKGRLYNLNQSDQLAGIRRHGKAMGYTPEEMRELDNLDDDEINMSMAEQIYDDHLSEMRWKESRHILAEYGQKYYKPVHEPPLLSTDDMKQIRHLHLEEKWPISVLANSFPASELIIKKVLKSGRILSLEEQFKHDEKVAQNWIMLRKGKLEISDELRQHCLRFTNRKARPMSSKDLAVLNSKPSRPPGSFLNIIKPPGEVEHNEIRDQSSREVVERHKESNRGQYSNHNTLQFLQERLTLEEARKRELEHLADKGTTPDEDVKAYVCGPGPSKDNLPDGNEREKFINNKTYVEQSVATKQKSDQFVSKWDDSGKSAKAARDAMMAPFIDYPDKISIPETSKKPGAIYRVEDCFYNEDGEFMYRVPGLKV